MERDVDVVVVGGGLAGLAAAATAARAGRRVVVLEARTHPGGRARTANRRGFLVNEGPHALYRGGEAMAVLDELDVEPEGGVPPGNGSMAFDGGGLHILPTGVGSLARTDLLGPRGKVELGRFLARLPRLRPEALRSTSVDAWLDDGLGDPRARAIVAALVRLSTYANDPEHLSTDVAVTQLQRGTSSGVLYLHGGWQSLVDALTARATEAGARLQHDVGAAKGQRVLRRGRNLGVAVGSEVIEAPSVIVAGGGPSALAGLLEAPPEEVRAWADGARPARIASLDVGLHGEWGDAPGFVLGIDRPLYLSVHTRVARLAPPGATLVSVMKYLRPGDPADPDLHRRELMDALDLVRPGWRDDAADILFRPALVASTDIPRPTSDGLVGRPGPAVPEWPGLYVAGDWVGPSGLLADAALASGVAAGQAAADHAGAVVAA